MLALGTTRVVESSGEPPRLPSRHHEEESETLTALRRDGGLGCSDAPDRGEHTLLASPAERHHEPPELQLFAIDGMAVEGG